MNLTFKQQKWVNIIVCFLMIFVCLGFCSANKSLFLSAICGALGIKRTVFSLATSCRYIATSVVNIFFGLLVSKFGTKKLIATGFVFLIGSMIISAFATAVEHFVLAEIFSGIGFSLSGTAMVGCVVNRWSPHNKGTIMGAILCANGIGGAVAAQIITPLIYNPDNAFGYRNAYWLIALLLIVTLGIILVFFKGKPKKGEKPELVAQKKNKHQRWRGLPYREAIKKPFFYMAVICIFFTGFCLQGITGISAAHMSDVGLKSSYVALMASVSLLALTGSKFLAGFMYDKFGLRKTATICSLAAVLCMVSLAFAANSGLGKSLCVVYAILSSVALPLETVMLPLYAADLFGDYSFDKIMGIFISVNTIGYAVGTPFVNLGFDLTGSYFSMLLLNAGIMLFVTIAMQFVISAAHKIRREAIMPKKDE